MKLKLRPEEILSLLLTLAALVSLVAFNAINFKSPTEILADMIKYFSFGDTLFSVFFFAIWIIFFWRAFKELYRLAVKRLVDKHKLDRTDLKTAVAAVLEPLRFLWPLALFAVPLYGLLGVMGVHLQADTKDLWLNGLDQRLFGFSPFLHFPSSYQDPAFETMIEFAYTLLQYVMALSLLTFLLLKKFTILRQFIFCFILSLMLGFPLYAAVPCQDPSNYFIRNLHQYELPLEVQAELHDYSPSHKVSSMIGRIQDSETDVAHNHNVPISCFPSDHALWSILIVYYLALLAPWTLAFSIPWAFCVMSGGIYFGQHYVVDYLMASLIATICITLAHLVIKPEQHR